MEGEDLSPDSTESRSGSNADFSDILEGTELDEDGNPKPHSKRRKYTNKACDNCRARHSRCDGKGSCEQCAKKGLVCNYSDPPTRRRPVSERHLQSLIASLAQSIDSDIQDLDLKMKDQPWNNPPNTSSPFGSAPNSPGIQLYPDSPITGSPPPQPQVQSVQQVNSNHTFAKHINPQTLTSSLSTPSPAPSPSPNFSSQSTSHPSSNVPSPSNFAFSPQSHPHPTPTPPAVSIPTPISVHPHQPPQSLQRNNNNNLALNTALKNYIDAYARFISRHIPAHPLVLESGRAEQIVSASLADQRTPLAFQTFAVLANGARVTGNLQVAKEFSMRARRALGSIFDHTHTLVAQGLMILAYYMSGQAEEDKTIYYLQLARKMCQHLKTKDKDYYVLILMTIGFSSQNVEEKMEVFSELKMRLGPLLSGASQSTLSPEFTLTLGIISVQLELELVKLQPQYNADYSVMLQVLDKLEKILVADKCLDYSKLGFHIFIEVIRAQCYINLGIKDVALTCADKVDELTMHQEFKFCPIGVLGGVAMMANLKLQNNRIDDVKNTISRVGEVATLYPFVHVLLDKLVQAVRNHMNQNFRRNTFDSQSQPQDFHSFNSQQQQQQQQHQTIQQQQNIQQQQDSNGLDKSVGGMRKPSIQEINNMRNDLHVLRGGPNLPLHTPQSQQGPPESTRDALQTARRNSLNNSDNSLLSGFNASLGYGPPQQDSPSPGDITPISSFHTPGYSSPPQYQQQHHQQQHPQHQQHQQQHQQQQQQHQQQQHHQQHPQQHSQQQSQQHPQQHPQQQHPQQQQQQQFQQQQLQQKQFQQQIQQLQQQSHHGNAWMQSYVPLQYIGGDIQEVNDDQMS